MERRSMAAAALGLAASTRGARSSAERLGLLNLLSLLQGGPPWAAHLTHGLPQRDEAGGAARLRLFI